jgi:hypothetical protein
MVMWLASYPRSGNTLLRQIIHSGWGARTTSFYQNDLGDNRILQDACGHYELPRGPLGVTAVPTNAIIKTHEMPTKQGRAIYMIRDGRAACVSFWHFYERKDSLTSIVMGLSDHGFGTWAHHVNAWAASGQVQAVLRYEDMMARHPMVVETLAQALGRPPEGNAFAPLDMRERLAEKEGRWVRMQADWRNDWSEELDQLFWRTPNNPMPIYYPEVQAASSARG